MQINEKSVGLYRIAGYAGKCCPTWPDFQECLLRLEGRRLVLWA